MSAGDEPGADTAEAFVASPKAGLGEGARSALDKSMEERRRDAVRLKGGIIARYICFAEWLVDEGVGPLVFLARDALPLKAIADHIATRDGKPVVTHAFALTRAMLPEGIQNLAGDFAARQAAIRAYVAGTASDQSQLHRFIAQELGDNGAAMLIDTGFWGTCASYASAYIEMAHGAEIGWRLLFGPKGSPAAFVDGTEEDLTSLVEHLFSFTYEYTGHFTDEGERLVPATERSRFEPGIESWYPWEIDELLKVADELC